MDLKQLKYFLYVAQQGSYTRAADVLNVAQPILSRQIRLLETELRQSLLIRHGRGVSLTDSGKILLEHCRIIMQQVEFIQEDLNLSSGKLGGHIVLGLPPTLARLLSLPLIRQFGQQLPEASLRIAESLSAQLQDRLQQGKIDMALLYNPAYSPDIETKLIYEEQLYLMVPAQDPQFKAGQAVSAAQLAELPLIMPSVPNTFRLLVEQEMARYDLPPTIMLEIDSVETIQQLVADGMGYSIQSGYSIRLMGHADRIRAVPIESPQLTNRLFLATSGKRKLTRTQQETAKLLVDLCLSLVGGKT